MTAIVVLGALASLIIVGFVVYKVCLGREDRIARQKVGVDQESHVELKQLPPVRRGGKGGSRNSTGRSLRGTGLANFKAIYV